MAEWPSENDNSFEAAHEIGEAGDSSTEASEHIRVPLLPKAQDLASHLISGA